VDGPWLLTIPGTRCMFEPQKTGSAMGPRCDYQTKRRGAAPVEGWNRSELSVG
jgi:hypothetical protein